jgi:two-component system, NtrC family, sensor histidine kinase KinB
MDIIERQIADCAAATRRLHALYAVSNILNQAEADGRNLSRILPRAFYIIVQHLEAFDGSIMLLNSSQQIKEIWPASETPRIEFGDAFTQAIQTNGLAAWVIRHRQAAIVTDTRADSRWLPRQAGHITTQEAWSALCVPFLTSEQVIGVFTIRKPGYDQFGEDDLDLLQAVASQSTSVIEKTRLLEESRRQLRISDLLNAASRAINSSLDLNEVMQSMLAQMNEFLHAEAISIALVDKSSNELVYQVAEGIGKNAIVGLRLPSNQGLSGWVMEHGQPVHVPDTSVDLRFKSKGDERTGHQTRAMICAPMAYKGRVLGTIQAINPTAGVFTTQDLELLVNLAAIASSAIANAQQFAMTQAAESRYTSLFQDSIDPIILAELSGKIVEANQRASAFTGYTREELLRMRIHALHPPDVKLPNVKRMQPYSARVFNSQIIAKNGRHLHVEVYAKRAAYGDSEFVQWIHHDISKQIELEEMRKDLQAMLFHDLQSPLGNVISSLELINYELPADSSPALLEMVEIAMRSSGRLQTLIRSLLDINKLEAGHPITEQACVRVEGLIEDAWEIVRPSFEKRKMLLLRLVPPDLPDVNVQADMIRRVLVNLLDNAIKYSPDSPQITLEVCQYDPEKLLVSVSDQGEGIPEAMRTVIFEKFQRLNTDTYSRGLGLGLAFCRLAIEGHGGQIWVDDAPNGGARFNFTLPIWVESKLSNER